MPRSIALAIAALALTCLAPIALAQDVPSGAPANPVAVEEGRLPAPVRTHHDVTLPDRTLHFTATVGAITVHSEQGQPLGEIGYVSYVLDDEPSADRPVTFAVNGGPGASSAWLHVGALGPWRLPLIPAAPERLHLEPNAETWLDFTDLVFLDPPGTGYARPFAPLSTAPAPERGRRDAGRRDSSGQAPNDVSRQLWSVGGDVAALTNAMQSWLDDNRRLMSPRMLVGESYGGFRGPRIAALMLRRKLPLDALVLISPVIDFDGRRSSFGPMPYVNVLPTIAAAELERHGSVPTREALADVETYAGSDYLVDLLRGPRDQAAASRLTARVAAITNLPEAVVRNASGRIGGFTYARQSLQSEGRIASVYDAGVTAPNPTSERRRGDPFLDPMSGPLTDATVALYRDRLGWVVDRPYELQSGEVLRGWIWPNSPNAPESMSALASVLTNRRTRVVVAHGFSDLVTPYFASALQLAQLSVPGDANRLQLRVYPGGHMFYSRDASRRQFRRDMMRLWTERSLMPAP